MSDYKRYFLKQIGVSEALKPAGIQPSEVDPSELEMGVDDEKDHTNDPGEQQTIALQHLKDKPDYYSRIKAAGLEEEGATPPAFPKIMSPTAMVTPVIAMAVRGSSTGGLPSGADREMSLPQTDGIDVSNLSPSQLGGYEPIPTAKDNSKLIGKTPNNPQINSSALKVDAPDTQIDPHPYQFQKAQGEPPQDVTGASTDSDDSLTLKMAMPKGVDVDLNENENAEPYRKHTGKSAEIQQIQINNLKRSIPNVTPQEIDAYLMLIASGDSHSDAVETIGGERLMRQWGLARGRSLQETFTRHLKLMNETIDARNLAECDCGPNCDCDGCKTHNKTSEPEKVEEKYSAPFAKMRGLANLGERRVAKNGLWESSHDPGENFVTHWKMDKEKAGMVKIDEKKLLSVKESLSKKTTLTEKESAVLKKIDEVLQKRTAK